MRKPKPAKSNRKPAKPIIDGDCAIIPLTLGYEALIDAEDAHWLGRFVWCAKLDEGKATATADSVPDVRMSRLVMGVTHAAKHVAFLNGNRLDCRKANLAVISIRKKNYRNSKMRLNCRGRVPTSRFKGVSRHRDKWRAGICIHGKTRHIGLYESEDAAAEAYNAALLAETDGMGRPNDVGAI